MAKLRVVFDRLSGKIRKLRARVSRKPSKTTTTPWQRPLQENSPPLLALPTELILCIADELEADDEFYLAMVCSRLRNILWRDWAAFFVGLDPARRLPFLLGISLRHPDSWVCRSCCRLQAIDLTDVPGCSELWYNSTRHRCNGKEFVDIERAYHIRERHVQLALKLARTNTNPAYLEQLLSPFWGTARGRAGQKYCPFVIATPKIVDGRFILGIEWNYRCTPTELESTPTLTTRLFFQSICPHLKWWGNCPRSPTSGTSVRWGPPHFQNDVFYVRAPTIDRQKIRGGCTYCPTDYELSVKHGIFRLRGWYDFGTERERIWDLHNSHIHPGTVSLQELYTPGAVRKLFVDDRSQELAVNRASWPVASHLPPPARPKKSNWPISTAVALGSVATTWPQ